MAVLTFITQHISTANATVYTFSSTSTGGANDIGATASDRQVIIAASISATTSATRGIASVTPGGVAAATGTQLYFTATTGALKSAAHTLVNALLTTATSISIVLTATTTVANAVITVWSATHVGATFATYGTWATDSDGYSFSTATNQGMNVTVSTSGFFVAHTHMRSATGGTPNYVWTSATENHDTFAEAGMSHSGADGTNTATVNCQASLSVTSGWWTGIWGAFDDQSPAAGGETLYRKFTSFPGTLAGRRKLITFPRPIYEWRPEARP